jgi:hypothetical protein
MHIRSLEESQEEFQRLGCKVVAVHYYTGENLEEWRECTQCRLHLITDPGRQLHKLFGLGRTKVTMSKWAIKHLNFYATAHAQGEKIYADFELGDSFQLGGDVIVDSKGKVVFNYRSKYPPDRVSVKDLLSALEQEKDACLA